MSIDPMDLLRLIPDDVLLAEVRERGLTLEDSPLPEDDAVIVGDLEVDPVGCVATWRGHAVELTRRETEVLYALALFRFQGVRWVRSDRLTMRVWRFADPSELATCRVYINYLRKKLPGLIASSPGVTGGKGSYHLALDARERAA